MDTTTQILINRFLSIELKTKKPKKILKKQQKMKSKQTKQNVDEMILTNLRLKKSE